MSTLKSDESKERLINLVRDRRSLWNPLKRNYKDARVSERLWKEISMYIGEPPIVCAQTWKYLRDCYVAKKKPSGSAGVKSKNSSLMESMRFIEDKIKPRQTLSNVGLAVDCEISVLTMDNEQLSLQSDENAGTFDTSTQGSTHSNTDLLRAYPPCEKLGLPFLMDRWDSSQNDREKVATKRKPLSPNMEFQSKFLKELEKEPDTDMQWLFFRG
uniref:MADF domain-containing protein n=1 Tax=Timema tahoe TaxID=61484 RepID=A0A7R9P0C9_9NEOP|nr:unnamed protein product [Timema tahoe]